MGLILDTSAAITAERQGQTAKQMVAAISAGDPDLAISVITVLELAHGVARAASEARRRMRQSFLDDLLSGMPVWPVTIPVALRAGQIDGLLQSDGIKVALADLLIGATALEMGYGVATHNIRHFRLIPNLTVTPL